MEGVKNIKEAGQTAAVVVSFVLGGCSVSCVIIISSYVLCVYVKTRHDAL